MVKLEHHTNEISIDLTGIDKPAAIEIAYSGKMYAESQLPSDWILRANKTRIICISLNRNSVPELLFKYTGKVRILGGTVTDESLQTYPISVKVRDIDYWERVTGLFNLERQNWENLGSTHLTERGLLATQIIRNALQTYGDEFFFADGMPYSGAYHEHQDGQAMTGEKHTEESEMIYRKDSKGQIYNPRKKSKKSQIKQIYTNQE